MKKGIIVPKIKPYIISSASVAGKRENEGPLGGKFDICDESDMFGQKTWEQSESEMQKIALGKALEKAGIEDSDIGLLFAGDLMNQCVGSNYGLVDYNIPYIGLYGACSTMSEGLMLSAMTVGFGVVETAAAVTSSHNCTAERQFRYPLEYGGQHAPTSQWTVTGSGAFVVKNGNFALPYIADVMPGQAIDRGITDINNMGAAMAPAAIDTLYRYFTESGKKPSDFDLIVTGDLGFEGHRIVCEFMADKGYDMKVSYNDCGLIIYDLNKQDMHSGGSGCGCSAVVLASHIYPMLCEGLLQNVLFIGTGALMNPATVQQGLSIPGIAHLVHIAGGKNNG